MVEGGTTMQMEETKQVVRTTNVRPTPAMTDSAQPAAFTSIPAQANARLMAFEQSLMVKGV